MYLLSYILLKENAMAEDKNSQMGGNSVINSVEMGIVAILAMVISGAILLGLFAAILISKI